MHPLHSIARPALEAIDLSRALKVETGFFVCTDKQGVVKTGPIETGVKHKLPVFSESQFGATGKAPCQTAPGDRLAGLFHTHPVYPLLSSGDIDAPLILWRNMLAVASALGIRAKLSEGKFTQCVAGIGKRRVACFTFTPNQELTRRLTTLRRAGKSVGPATWKLALKCCWEKRAETTFSELRKMVTRTDTGKGL